MSSNNDAQDPETPYEGGEMADTPTMGRQGHLFFGRFCDMRKAVVGVNIFNIALTLLGCIVKVVRYTEWGPIEAAMPVFILSGIGLYGAMHFELWAVAMASIGFIIGICVDLWLPNWLGILVGLLVVYPHAMLTYEIKKGIMSQENYKKEEFAMDFNQVKSALPISLPTMTKV